MTVGISGPDRPLQCLEADVWAGIAARARGQRVATMMIAGQVAVLTMALGTSFTLGTRAGALAQARPSLGLSWIALTPTALLFGTHL